jgi:hypothetical protein
MIIALSRSLVQMLLAEAAQASAELKAKGR